MTRFWKQNIETSNFKQRTRLIHTMYSQSLSLVRNCSNRLSLQSNYITPLRVNVSVPEISLLAFYFSYSNGYSFFSSFVFSLTGAGETPVGLVLSNPVSSFSSSASSSSSSSSPKIKSPFSSISCRLKWSHGLINFILRFVAKSQTNCRSFLLILQQTLYIHVSLYKLICKSRHLQ